MDVDVLSGRMPSWRPGPAKEALLRFLVDVTHGPDSLPPSERVAAFDNDGTMACEKPHTALAAFLASTSGQDGATAPALSGHEVLRELGRLFQGQTTAAYDVAARQFLQQAVHPRLGRPYPLLTYQPMLELVNVLHALEFSVFMCTDSSRDFMRVMGPSAYGLRREQVIGSEVQIKLTDGQLVRTAAPVPMDDGPGKVEHLWDRAGTLPVLAGGNAAGDIPMLEAAGFAMVIRHDDPTREYAYDDPHVLEQARLRDWTVISMLSDFAQLWPPLQDGPR